MIMHILELDHLGIFDELQLHHFFGEFKQWDLQNRQTSGGRCARGQPWQPRSSVWRIHEADWMMMELRWLSKNRVDCTCTKICIYIYVFYTHFIVYWGHQTTIILWMVQLVCICMYVYIYTCTLDYLGGFFLFLRSELKLHTLEICDSKILHESHLNIQPPETVRPHPSQKKSQAAETAPFGEPKVSFQGEHRWVGEFHPPAKKGWNIGLNMNDCWNMLKSCKLLANYLQTTVSTCFFFFSRSQKLWKFGGWNPVGGPSKNGTQILPRSIILFHMRKNVVLAPFN